MLIDFTDPKENFVAQHRSTLEATARHKLFFFIDRFSGYNQVLINLEYQDKITFIMDHITYCYKVISFDLKNKDTTYKMLVNRMFAE